MPRVNRDLQRRMAARRERERRRPSPERRYQFASAESAALEAQETLAAMEAEQTGGAIEPRESARQRALAAASGAGRAGSVARATPQPFSAFSTEYAYVTGDLRRVGVVIGSLLVILILLYFVLPH